MSFKKTNDSFYMKYLSTLNRSKDDGNYKQKTLKRPVKYSTNFKHCDKVSDSGNGRLTSQMYYNYKIDLNRCKMLTAPRNSEWLRKF